MRVKINKKIKMKKAILEYEGLQQQPHASSLESVVPDAADSVAE